MCSFGYVLTDESFNIIETDDIVMNPECEFDWYLFANKNDIKLAYPREHFRKQPNFTTFYERIKKLATAENRLVFGFSSLNDVGFVVTACERYNLPRIDFAAYDLEKIIKKDEVIFGSLEKRCEILGCDNSDLQAHKSSDDAIMTMRLLRNFVQKENLSVSELCQKNQQQCYSSKQFLKRREQRAKKKARKARFAESFSVNRRRKDSKTIRFD